MSDHHPSQYGAINKAGDAVVRVVDSVTDAAKATVGDISAVGTPIYSGPGSAGAGAGIDGPAGGYTQNNPHQGLKPVLDSSQLWAAAILAQASCGP